MIERPEKASELSVADGMAFFYKKLNNTVFFILVPLKNN